MAEGVVKWFSPKKGYGFIEQEGGPTIFVVTGFRSLDQGFRVTFDIEQEQKGPAAKNVTIV